MGTRLAIESPVGRLVLEESHGCLTGVRWSNDTAAADDTALLTRAAHQLEAYFRGGLQGFDLPLAPAGSAFERRVWCAMSDIAYGETATYGALGRKVEAPARAIGGACASNPLPIIVPCHRVVAATGLGGYSGAGGLETKRMLLELEGALAPRLL